jgi:hypothetical protein
MNSSPSPISGDDDLRRARTIARALDTAIGIPGTKVRLGLDPILGLIPGGGDAVSALLSGYIVLIATRRGVPRAVIWRMLGNIGVDTLIGSVPILGDFFDVAWKSNIRNVELLERHAGDPAVVERSSRRLGVVVVALLLLVLALLTAGLFLVVRLLWRALT